MTPLEDTEGPRFKWETEGGEENDAGGVSGGGGGVLEGAEWDGGMGGHHSCRAASQP